MKTGGMWFTFPQLAGGANVTFLNPSLDLSIAVERGEPFPMKERFQNKTKKLNGTKSGSGRMEAIATTTHVGGKMFSEVGGGRQTDALKTKEGDSVHSTFSTKKEWKRVGGLCQHNSLGVNDHHLTSVVVLLCHAEMLLSNNRVTLDRTSRASLQP